MDDPYKVLGLRRGASDDEIRAAYHELVKKYHPDKYQNNPLADLAEEKLREINEAYELLMKTSGHTTSVGGQSYTYGSTGSGYGYDNGQAGSGYYYDEPFANAQNSTHYSVREALDRNQFSRAEQLLASDGNRDPEWYFLAGVLSYKKGYYDDALGKVGYALRMSPNNKEYLRVYQQIMNTGTLYRQTSTRSGYDNSSMCMDLITCYCCSSLISPCW